MSTIQAGLASNVIRGDKLRVELVPDKRQLEAALGLLPRVKLFSVTDQRQCWSDYEIRLYGQRGSTLILFLKPHNEAKPLMRYNRDEGEEKVRQMHIPDSAVAIEYVN